jgi:endonuclease G
MRGATLGLLVLIAVPLDEAPAQTIEQRIRALEREVADLRQRLPTVIPAGAPLAAPPSTADGFANNVHLQWGFPGGSCSPLNKDVYITCHDNERRLPQWVTYRLRRQDLENPVSERTDDFRPDPELEAIARAELADYRSSGYDRGHMAPAADFKRSDDAMSTTFLLSNMAPQRPNLNRRIWAQLEDQVRQLTQSHGRVWIFTGALYLDGNDRPTTPAATINGRVAVPTHFYKAILCEHANGNRELFGYLLPNQLDPIADPLDSFAVTVDRLEELSGLDFFAALPDAEETQLQRIRRVIPN